MGTLLAALVMASLGLGLLLAGGGRFAPVRRVGRVAALVMGGAAVPLLFGQGAHWPLPFRWPPGPGPAALELAAPGVYIVVGLFVSTVAGLRWGTDRSPPRALPQGFGLAPLTCGLVVVAVTIDQFLLRYVALELVALVTAASLYSTLPAYHHGAPVWRTYLPWKLGDDALLLAILIMERATGTFHIQGALEGALLLHSTQRLAVVGCVALAAWVKLGLPPFHGWLLDAGAAPPPPQLWQATAGLPVLGAYLLYRFHGVIGSLGLWPALAGVGVLAAAGPTLAAMGRERRVPSTAWWPVWHGALAFPCAALGLGRWYLIAFVPVRVLLAAPSVRGRIATTPAGVPSARLPAPLAFAVDVARVIDIQVLGRGIGALGALVHGRAADLARAIDARVLGGATGALAGLVHEHGAAQAARVERRLHAANARAAELAHAFAGHLQRRHAGRLRGNLLWAVFGLLGVVLAAMLSRGV